MKIVVNKTLLISVSLLLALSSCGKSKDLKTAPSDSVAPTGEPAPQEKAPDKKTPEVKPPATPVPATPAPTEPVGPPEVPAQPSGPQAQVPAAPPAQLPAAPGQTPNRGSGPTANQTEMGPRNLIPQQPNSALNNEDGDYEVLPPLPVAPFQNPNGQTNVLNPPLQGVSGSEQRAYQVDFRNQVAVKTGGKTKDLFYTTAGKDGLMEEFKSYNLKVSKEQQSMNSNLAKAIVVAKLTRQTSSGEVSVMMNFDEFGVVKTYRLVGSSQGDMMKLTLSRSGTTGDMEFQGGFLKCLDADGGCETAYAKIKFAGGYTRVIFRNSLADMHFQYQENVANNSGFKTWMRYISNSINSVPTSDVFDSLQLSSYEVLNGRAGMGALLTTNDREMVGLSIPLVVSGSNSEVDAPVAKLTDLTANYDLSSQARTYSQNLAQKINGVKLIYNNGLGQLKLNMNLGTPQAPASIWLVAARVQKDILSLEQVRSFEAKLKNF